MPLDFLRKSLIPLLGGAGDGFFLTFARSLLKRGKGKGVFASNCATCHRVGQQGRDVGPELALIRNKFDRVGLLDAIINPSAGIVFGYEPWLVTMKGDESIYGFLIADGPTVTLKDPSGSQHVVKADQIETRKKMETSLMPDPTALNLTDKN